MAGGVVMNAGVGHKVAPREFHEIVESFDVLSFDVEGELQEITYKQNDVRWEYRHSREWQPGVITRVRVRWPNKPDDQVLKDVREGNKRRKSTQPLSEPSCGSVFKNPTGDYAGRLIEACGLKGFSIGGAQVSEKHANFIVNKDNSTALDIHKVIEHVQKVVQEKYQMRLTNEVVYLGEWD
jgi:UDP-N-acetylmuramate dehydrogenase